MLERLALDPAVTGGLEQTVLQLLLNMRLMGWQGPPRALRFRRRRRL